MDREVAKKPPPPNTTRETRCLSHPYRVRMGEGTHLRRVRMGESTQGGEYVWGEYAVSKTRLSIELKDMLTQPQIISPSGTRGVVDGRLGAQSTKIKAQGVRLICVFIACFVWR